MDYVNVANTVIEARHRAESMARYEMIKHRRKIELSENKDTEIKRIIGSLDYESTIAGTAYIHSGYNAGSTFVDIRDGLTDLYLKIRTIKSLKDPLAYIMEDACNFYSLFLQETELWDMLYRKTSQNKKALRYAPELLYLFKGNRELIAELFGKPDHEIAYMIHNWAEQQDEHGNPLIENPLNNLKRSFATELKKAGIVRMSIDRFSRLL